jgi:WXG100 family type VII secretion target
MNDFSIRATPEVLTVAAEAIGANTKALETTFSEMRTKVQQTSSFWTGEAAELHRSLFEEQIPAMEALIGRFRSRADQLRQIADNYAGVRAAVQTTVEELPADVIV